MGSNTTRVVVGEFLKGEKYPKILGVGEVESKGLRHGYVTHFADAVESVKKAVDQAEKTSGIKIRKAFVSAGGISLRGYTSSGEVIISKADGEVTSLDISKAQDKSESNLAITNKKVIHSSPISYKLDGQDVQGRLEGMRGNKLEAKTFLVTYSVQHLEDLIAVLAEAGVEAIGVTPGPIAESHIALNQKQKIVGCALVNIGAESLSLSVFENGILISMHTFSIGGADITNDIALGLKIPLEKAEKLKLGLDTEEFPKKKLDEIIEARLGDIFELIENHLKKIKRAELLPAGIILTGGGANITGLAEFAKDTLKLPSEIGQTEIFGALKTKLRNPEWFTALGLLMGEDEEGRTYDEGSFFSIFKDFKKTIKATAKQLMP